MHPMMLPLLMYQRWLELFLPRKAEKPQTPSGYEG
jgi:hypothetical protein